MPGGTDTVHDEDAVLRDVADIGPAPAAPSSRRRRVALLAGGTGVVLVAGAVGVGAALGDFGGGQGAAPARAVPGAAVTDPALVQHRLAALPRAAGSPLTAALLESVGSRIVVDVVRTTPTASVQRYQVDGTGAVGPATAMALRPGVTAAALGADSFTVAASALAPLTRFATDAVAAARLDHGVLTAWALRRTGTALAWTATVVGPTSWKRVTASADGRVTGAGQAQPLPSGSASASSSGTAGGATATSTTAASSRASTAAGRATGGSATAPSSPAVTGAPILTDHAVVAAMAALRTVRAKHPLLQVWSVLPHTLSIRVQDERHPGRLLTYTVDATGRVGAPQVVTGTARSAASLAALAFDPATVPFARAAEITRKALAAAHVAAGRVASWQVQRTGGQVGWLIQVIGPDRTRVLVQASATGVVRRVQRLS